LIGKGWKLAALFLVVFLMGFVVWELRDFGEPSGEFLGDSGIDEDERFGPTYNTEYGDGSQIDIWDGDEVVSQNRTMMDDTFLDESADPEGTVNANNVVTAIVFDYRGFDTLGEATVLFAAVTGVLATIRIAFPKKKEEEGGDAE
jgi:hypothetical protein